MDNNKTLDELYAEYGEFLRNDPEEQKIQQAKKKRRAKCELMRAKMEQDEDEYLAKIALERINTEESISGDEAAHQMNIDPTSLQN